MIVRQLISPLREYRYLLEQLILRDIKARYKQSIIGGLWVFLNPLIQLSIYTFVFSIILKIQYGSIPFTLYLFSGLVPWIFLQTSLSQSINSFIENSGLIKKIYFPREIFIYSTIFSKTIDFGVGLLTLFVLMTLYHSGIGIQFFFLLPVIIIQIILTIGLSLLLATLNLLYRDIQYLVNPLLMIWMYLTPILYPINLIPNQFLMLYSVNPMVGIVEGYRFALFHQPLNILSFLWSTIASVILFIVGFIIFKKLEKVFAEVV